MSLFPFSGVEFCPRTTLEYQTQHESTFRLKNPASFLKHLYRVINEAEGEGDQDTPKDIICKGQLLSGGFQWQDSS